MLSVIAICSSIIILCYAVYVITLLRYWSRPTLNAPTGSDPALKVAVIVPFRNEAHHLPTLLNALLSQDFTTGNAEFIFVNDHSEDSSCSIIQRFQQEHCLPIKLLNLPANAFGKKAAVHNAIEASGSDIIVTIDADALPEANWLRRIENIYHQNEADLVILPVLLAPAKTRLERLQQVDFLQLSGITGAAANMHSAVMCNGANLSFWRKSYLHIMNNITHQNLLSGDDMFLMLAMKHAGMKIHYYFDSSVIIKTKPCETLKDLLQQRVRWASKINALSDKHIVVSGLILSLANWSVSAIVISSLITPSLWMPAITLLLIKMSVEYWFAHCIAQSFRCKLRVDDALLLSLFYPVYFILIPLLIVIYPTKWKGRAISLRTSKKA